jgi:hypothetical protein
MSDINGRRGGDVTNCPECAGQVRADFISDGDELACKSCGCRFTLPSFGMGRCLHWADEDQVIEHGNRWRRILFRPYIGCLSWAEWFFGVGVERLYPGGDMNIGLGPISLNLYVGPGVP